MVNRLEIGDNNWSIVCHRKKFREITLKDLMDDEESWALW